MYLTKRAHLNQALPVFKFIFTFEIQTTLNRYI